MKIEISQMLSLCDNKSISKKGEGCKIDFLEVIGNTLDNQLYDDDIKNNKVEESYTDSIHEVLDEEKDVNDKLSEIIISLLNNINMNQDKNENVILNSQISKSNLVNILEQDNKKLWDLLFIKNNINTETNDNISKSNKTEEVLFNEVTVVNEEKINLDLDNGLVKDKFKEIVSNTNIIDTLKEMNVIDNKVLEKLLISANDNSVNDDVLELLAENLKGINSNIENNINNVNLSEKEINEKIDIISYENKLNILKEIDAIDDKLLEKLLANKINNTLLEVLTQKLKNVNVNTETNINDVSLINDEIEIINEELDKISNEDIIKKVNNNKSKLEGLIDKIKLTNNVNEINDNLVYKNEENLFNEFNIIENDIKVIEGEKLNLTLDTDLVKGNSEDVLSNKNILNFLKEIGVIDDKSLEKLLADKNVNNVNDTLLEVLNRNLKNVNKENNINYVNLRKDGIEIINEKVDKIDHEDIIKQVINKNNKSNLEGLIDKIKLTNNVNEIKNNLIDKNNEVLFNEFNFVENEVNFLRVDKFNLTLDKNLIEDNVEDIVSNIDSLESLETINNKSLEMFLTKTNINNDNREKNINNIDLNRDTFEVINEKVDNLSEEYILKEVINKDSKLSLEGLLNEIKLINNEKDNDLLNKKEKKLFNEINISEEEKINFTLDNASSNDNFEDIFDMSFTNKEYVSKKIKVKDKIENIIFSEYENSNNIVRNNSINQKNLELLDEEVLNTGIRQEYINEDFIKAIDYIKNNNIEELDVKMNPEDLGEISIKVLKDKGNEKIIITLENDEVLKLLNDNINEIQNHLHNKDIVVKSVNIEIKNNNLGNFTGDLERDLNKNNHKEEKRHRKNIIKNNTKDNYLEKDDKGVNLLI